MRYRATLLVLSSYWFAKFAMAMPVGTDRGMKQDASDDASNDNSAETGIDATRTHLRTRSLFLGEHVTIENPENNFSTGAASIDVEVSYRARPALLGFIAGFRSLEVLLDGQVTAKKTLAYDERRSGTATFLVDITSLTSSDGSSHSIQVIGNKWIWKTRSSVIVFSRTHSQAVDLRPNIQDCGIEIRNQGSRGTCSVFALTFLLEYMYCTRTTSYAEDLSEEYLNYVTDDGDNGNGADGDFFHNIDAGYKKWGIVPESYVPYQQSGPVSSVSWITMQTGSKIYRFKADFIKPWDSTRGATANQIHQVQQYLLKDTPVAIGAWWPSQGHRRTQTIQNVELMKVPNDKTHMFDGHSVDLVGMKIGDDFPGGGYFIFRNSWGDWNVDGGDHGYGFMAFEYVEKYANDLVAYTV